MIVLSRRGLDPNLSDIPSLGELLHLGFASGKLSKAQPDKALERLRLHTQKPFCFTALVSPPWKVCGVGGWGVGMVVGVTTFGCERNSKTAHVYNFPA